MAIKRSDKAANVDKIAAAVIKDPLASEKEIAKSAGVSRSTVQRIKNEVNQSEAVQKDKRIQSLTDTDYEIVALSQSHTLKKLKDAEQVKNTSLRDLSYVGDVSAKRYSVLVGEATDNQGGLKATPEELDLVNKALKLNGFNVGEE